MTSDCCSARYRLKPCRRVGEPTSRTGWRRLANRASTWGPKRRRPPGRSNGRRAERDPRKRGTEDDRASYRFSARLRPTIDLGGRVYMADSKVRRRTLLREGLVLTAGAALGTRWLTGAQRAGG